MQKKKKNAQNDLCRFAAQLAAASLSGMGAAALLLSGFAVLCCKVDFAPQTLSFIPTGAVVLAVLFAGFVLALLRREKGLLYGLLMGAAFYVFLWIAALAQGQTEFSALAAIKGAALLCSGAIGGFLGILLQERRRRIRK